MTPQYLARPVRFDHRVAESPEPQPHHQPGRLAHVLATAGIRAKLKVGEPGDVYEREADDVADRVMGGRNGIPSATSPAPCCTGCASGAGCSGDIQRRSADGPMGGPGRELDLDVETQIRSGGAGEPLPDSTRIFFEERFSRGFGDVRVHSGPEAAQLSDDVHAHAFTHGSHVWLGSGIRPEPSHVMAHELAHVVQQAGPRAAFDGMILPEYKHPVTTQTPRPVVLKQDGKLVRPLQKSKVTLTTGAPVLQRACGPSAIGKRDSCDMSPGFFPPFATPYLFNVNCDTMAPGTADRLRKDFKAGDRVIVHGFASIEGEPKYNENLSCARCEKAATFLKTEIGATVVEVHAYGAVPGPRVPRRSVLVYKDPKPEPKPPPSSPATNVCGPDIDAQLTAVLADVQQYFRGLSRWHKHRSCQQLESPFAYIMAWDINQLYLPNTDWLRSSAFSSTSPPCSLPRAAAGQDVEDPGICGNTVRVNGKCNLAGTVNYAVFGIMMSECYDFYNSVPWYAALLRTQLPFYNERAMRALIWAYKKLDHDDPGPPTEFAWATFDQGPSGRPNTENRPNCKAPCESKATPPRFTFTWEPYQGRP